ncbi:Ribosomal-protein-S5p-alanine acetyltransferase [Streptococcus sp. DD10]|uniref:GNAT family N-acetyltransferase n=1 Tax=Streptococcus sp. DD10 TaxID=1777878 RepID=UPI00079C8C66|nr:GNAT family N-acetyltransferase [Streptococcus sp. DD10]KXT76491.1 Ribosomal-protein-S5p-alanine acetyltransferase [Streptococcus sp. DD10]
MNLWTRLAAYAYIETQHLILRPFCFSDATDFYVISGNADNLEFIFPAQSSISEAEYALANYFMKQPLGTWAICTPENRMIGAIRFEKIDEVKREAEIGYFLLKDFWGQGLMTESLKELVSLSFTVFNFKKLKIIVHLENLASRRVAEKCGFSLVRQYKGSDRYSRKMRDYLEFCFEKEHYNE